MFREDQLLPISALSHLLFCERRCALVHIEGLWAENRFTAEGMRLHRRAHDGPDQTRNGLRTCRGLALASLRLGLVGVADVVEFHPEGPPLLVEYKRGRPRPYDVDRVQLCAQALCLEEMLKQPGGIPCGAVFYGKTRRRLDVAFDDPLRTRTEAAARRLHDLIAAGVTPLAQYEPKCDGCSMRDLCLPGAQRPRRTPAAYLRQAAAASLNES